MPKKNPEEELFTNFYEELPVDDPKTDDPDPDPDPDPEPVDDEPVEGDEPKVEPEPGGEGGDDDPDPDEDKDDKKPKKKDPRDQPVPFSRYQKLQNEKKELERKLAAKDGKPVDDNPAGDPDPDPDDDPDADKPGEEAEKEPELDERSQQALSKFLKEKGYVPKSEVDRQTKLTEFRAQVEEDTKVLTAEAEEKGYPTFNTVEVDNWADENLGKGFVKNRKTLKAAYMAMHEEEILEQNRKSALADATENNATGERPGAGAKTTPVEDEPTGRGALRKMIHNARVEIDKDR